MAREEFEGIDRFVRGAALEETNGLLSSETKCFSVEMVEKFFINILAGERKRGIYFRIYFSA